MRRLEVWILFWKSKKRVKLDKIEKIVEKQEQDYKDLEARAAWARASKDLMRITFGGVKWSGFVTLVVKSYLPQKSCPTFFET